MNFRFWRKPSELEEQEHRYKALADKLRLKELAHDYAAAASRLERMESDGVPFYEPQPPQFSSQVQNVQTTAIPVAVYAEDPVSGYPFLPRVHYEQVSATRFESDPIFGYLINSFADYAGAGFANAGLNSFPREMFPQLPTTLRTQIAQDAARWESRIWYETHPTYAGIISHLSNYVCGTGMTIECTLESEEQPLPGRKPEKEAQEQAPESPQDVEKGLSDVVKDYLEEFATSRCNDLQQRVRDAVVALFRDGESFERLYPQIDYPLLRPIDASWVRGAHNEINGPWSLGILTRYPIDNIEPLAYHVWLPDNTHHDVAPEQMYHIKLYSSSVGNVKRGTPLSYRIRKQLPQLAKLVDCLAIGEAARQAIPYIQQFQVADRAQVQGAINARIPAPYNLGQTAQDRSTIIPGEVRHINAGQEYKAAPEGHADSGEVAYNVLCQVIANALNIPLWMVSASVREETKANAMTAETPVIKLITHVQELICDHFTRILESVVKMGIARGQLPLEAAEVEICLELPSPISRDLADEINLYKELVNQGVCAPQTLAARFDLDFDEQRALIEVAGALGWESPADIAKEAADKSADNSSSTPSPD